MSDSVDDCMLKSLCDKCGVLYGTIKPKLLEIMRKINMKFPPGTLPQQFESIRHIIAIEISCHLQEATYNKGSFAKASHLKDSEYQRGINLIKSALHVTWNQMSIMDLLAINFGATFKSCAYKLLERYQTKCNETIQLATSSARIDVMNQAAYQSAAFFLSLKQRKVCLYFSQLCLLFYYSRPQC